MDVINRPDNFAHPFKWTYRGDGLHRKVVRRFRRLLEMESPQLETVFLTKQLLLMGNLVGDYWSQVQETEWQELHHALCCQESYLSDLISSAKKERQKQKAQRALEELHRKLYDSLVKSGRIVKSA